MITNLLAVMLGSAVGGGLRYLLSYLFTHLSSPVGNDALERHAAYWGIATVNLSGCFLIGLLAALAADQFNRFIIPESPAWLFLAVGVLGGYTTFSAFGLQFLELVQQERLFSAAIYSIMSVLGGLLLTYCGFQSGKLLTML